MITVMIIIKVIIIVVLLMLSKSRLKSNWIIQQKKYLSVSHICINSNSKLLNGVDTWAPQHMCLINTSFLISLGLHLGAWQWGLRPVGLRLGLCSGHSSPSTSSMASSLWAHVLEDIWAPVKANCNASAYKGIQNNSVFLAQWQQFEWDSYLGMMVMAYK